MWTVFEVFIEFVMGLLLFLCFCFFDLEACGILALRPGIEPAHLVLKGRVSTTGPPRKSHIGLILTCVWISGFTSVFCFRQQQQNLLTLNSCQWCDWGTEKTNSWQPYYISWVLRLTFTVNLQFKFYHDVFSDYGIDKIFLIFLVHF